MLNEGDVMSGRYKLLIESINGIIWEATPGTLGLTFVSDSLSRILGYTPAQWLTDRAFWINCIYKDDRDMVMEHYRTPSALQDHTMEFRMVAADGSVRWLRNYVSLVRERNDSSAICGVMLDITKSKQLETLEKLEKQVLELNAKAGVAIEQILCFYVAALEDIFPDMKCSVLRVANSRVFNWASPSLPANYVNAIHGLSIGPMAGSCGTAAYTGQRVIVSDIATDEKWAAWKELALACNFRACWSEPIKSADGAVMATFAIYYPIIKAPTEDELSIIERAASLLKVIMDNKRYAATITEMNDMAEQAQELANFGTWQWDFKDDHPRWSDSLYKIFGLKPGEYSPTYESYLSHIHPDDKSRVKYILDVAHDTKTDATYDERILRSDGTVRYLRSWFRVIIDERGEPLKFIGASLDITDAKETEQRMQNIAWQQSHVIRAPLARIMGLVNLLNDDIAENDAERKSLYNLILASANEMDGVIRTITYHTQKG